MVKVHILGELFFSQVLGKPIFDGNGRRVGILRDMAVKWSGITPQVTGIKFAKDLQNHIDINQIDSWDEKGLILKGPLDQDNMKQLQNDEIYVGKWLLDKQIIDLKGSKLVRVNDIKLSWVSRGQSSDIILVAVDIGLRGLLRRIGLEGLAKKRPYNLLGWQFITPMENKTANLQLTGEQNKLSQMHPVDIADLLENMDHRERSDFLYNLDNQTAAEALAEVDLDTQVGIIEQMDSERASDILEEMGPDEAADILGELTDQKSSELLTLMEPEDAEDVRELMAYPEDTAGALMTTEYISFPQNTTAEETINGLRELAPAAETIYYLYVVDENEQLLGVVSLRELIIAAPQAALKDIMISRIVSVDQHADNDKVLEIVTKYNLLALPVVDETGQMLGIITIDDVLETVLPDRSSLETFPHFMTFRRPKWGWKE